MAVATVVELGTGQRLLAESLEKGMGEIDVALLDASSDNMNENRCKQLENDNITMKNNITEMKNDNSAMKNDANKIN